MINKKWKCHYRRFELSEANIWMLLNRQKWPSSWIDPNLNSKSHKINLQLFDTESNLDTLWYLFIVNSRNNHWKSHRKNSCYQRRYVYNWGDFSFSTLFPSLRHRNNWQDIASMEISDRAWHDKTSSKTSGGNIFEKHCTKHRIVKQKVRYFKWCVLFQNRTVLGILKLNKQTM